MKRALLALVLAAVAFLVVGCNPQVAGTVVDKSVTGGYYYTTTQMICNGNGSCTPIIQTHYMPESYWLTVEEDTTGDEHSVSVNLGYWDSVELGDHFDNRERS